MEDGIMKKLLYFGLFAALSVVACTRNQEMDVPVGNLTLVAVTEGQAPSKTVVEDGTHVYWEPGDGIAVFSGDKTGKFVATLKSSSSTATFRGSLGTDAWPEEMDLWAVYPYSEEATFDGVSITTVLPSEQAARAGSFGKDVNLSVAHSTNNTLQFYNVGGGIRFSVAEEGIQEVVLEGMDGEILSGKVKVGFQNGVPAVLEVTEGKTSISVTPSEGGTFAKDTWYYIVAIPGALEKGFKLHFQKADDIGFRVFDKTVTIKRSVYGTLTHADEGATYTTVTDENIQFKDNLVKSIVVEHFDTGKDGELSYREAAVVLSFLVDKAETRADDGKVSIFAGTGITSFDELVYFTGLTRIEDGAFAGCTELESITIPENIAVIGDNAFNGCTNLESITVTSSTPPSIGTDAFANTGECPILVPEGAVETYVAAWGEYENRIRPNEYPEPEAVDLGLPSGVKWASFNLGATSPEEYGHYYAWGDTEPYYSSLDPLTWTEGKENGYQSSTYKWCQGPMQKMSKYCVDSNVGYNGFSDGRTVLDPEDDAACANLGGNWRMPTDAEWAELMENCTWTWTTRDGVNGRLVTAGNGKSIFLPAAGYRYGVNRYSAGILGVYWSSSLNESDSYTARQIGCNSNGFERGYSGRYNGYPVRPVQGDRIPVESVSLDRSELELIAGKTACLSATILPENAHDISILWSSSDESIATVYYNGIVMAVAPGTATVTVTTLDGGKTASCTVTVLPAQETTAMEAIDLGLSVKWGSFNLGATKPEEYGDYFAWGETEPKEDYSWSSYKWCMGSNDSMTKYNTVPSFGQNGFTDGESVLVPEDDAANVYLGGNWRMPTYAEWVELLNNCTWTWITQNGVNGRLVTASNGNSIFLPATGIWMGAKLYDVGSWGHYRSSTLYESSSYRDRGVSIYSDGISHSVNDRYYGESIRPVYGNRIPVASVSLDQSELEIIAGNTAYLRATILPENAHDMSISWSSSDESIATVSYNGIVTAVAPGTATVTVTALDGGKTASCTVTVLPAPETATPEAIDLGLSVKWASFNLGARKPEEAGRYYAWGETEPYYSSLDPLTWEEGKESGYDWPSYKWCMGSYTTMTKYCNKASGGYDGYVDNKTVLDPEDDAAFVKLGDKWRMPTAAEFRELFEKCTFYRISQNGVIGWSVTGPNGNRVFLPTEAGYRYQESSREVGFTGYYWSSTFFSGGDAFHGYSVLLYRSEDRWMFYGHNRCSGLSIRPVYGDPGIPVGSVSLNKTEMTLSLGKSDVLTATVSPADATFKDVIWTSGNPNVVTVSSKGVVTAVGAGSTWIKAESFDPNITAFCMVTVPYPVPEAIDLGLSVQWASFNLGASSEEDSGGYFAWGDPDLKMYYGWNTYKWSLAYNTWLTKYCADADYGYNGFTDGKTVLEPDDDVAAVTIGGKWRMPTMEELNELVNDCSWSWEAQGAKIGYRVTGPSGNSIFLPVSGYWSGPQCYSMGEEGFYWSSTLSSDRPDLAKELSLGQSSFWVGTNSRCFGFSIRPVYGDR